MQAHGGSVESPSSSSQCLDEPRNVLLSADPLRFDTYDRLRLAALDRVKLECGVRGFLSASAAACLGFACAPALAQNAQPTLKATAPTASEPAKIRRAETIVDDNWTVTCAQTDQGGAKRQCSAVLKIAQSDANGAQRIVFAWVIGHQEGRLVSALSMPSGVLIPPGVQIGSATRRPASSAIRSASQTTARRSFRWRIRWSKAWMRLPRPRSRSMRSMAPKRNSRST